MESRSKERADKGCSKILRKAEAWLRELARDGCTATVLLRDLDREDEDGLRKRLQAITVPAPMRLLICIPKEELEAWFWADPQLVAKITGGRGKASPTPELIRSPKEKFIELSRGPNQKSRYQTNMNKELAGDLDLELCAQRCRAFRELRDFIARL